MPLEVSQEIRNAAEIMEESLAHFSLQKEPLIRGMHRSFCCLQGTSPIPCLRNKPMHCHQIKSSISLDVPQRPHMAIRRAGE